MASCSMVLLLAGVLSLITQFDIVRAQQLPRFTLGFFSPAAASEIPASLALEWKSAFQVALEVLNAKNRTYVLTPFSQNSGCDWQAAYHGADVLVNLDPGTYPPIIGVVGPACSGAAMASSSVLKHENISMVSFAATAEPISADRNWFDNLFRTVYSDKYQGQAIAASMAKLNMTAATIIHTKKYYSMNLAQNINESVNGAIPVKLVMLQNGENSTIDSVQLKTVLDQHDPQTVVILVMHPQEAQDAFAAINQQGRLANPWWYFGTDGVTALDPVDESPALVSKLVGEIGLAPYGGDYSNNSSCEEYFLHWQKSSYPGLPLSGITKSGSYTPYLIDTVRLYFEVCDMLVAANQTISARNVWNALKTSPPQFDGCTGRVAIDPLTGSRNVAVQPPIYDLVTMAQNSWQVKGRIQNNNFTMLQTLERPIGQPSVVTKKKTIVGAIVGATFGVLAVKALIFLGVHLYKRRQDKYHPLPQ